MDTRQFFDNVSCQIADSSFNVSVGVNSAKLVLAIEHANRDRICHFETLIIGWYDHYIMMKDGVNMFLRIF